jgi:hypothetical protein
MGKIAISQPCAIDRRRYVFATSALVASGLAATLGTAALVGGGYAASQAMSGKKGSSGSSAMPQAPTIGAAPTVGVATEAEKARIRKKSKTILTGPLQGDEFGAGGPTLLGSGDATKKVTLG